MDQPAATQDTPPLGDATKRLAGRLFAIFENRLQLLMVEAQEERDRISSAICMAVVMVIFSLLAGITLTLLVAVAFWDHYPVIALLVLAGIYVIVAAFFYAKLIQLQREWQTLPSTIDQLKKDRECLEKLLT
jgi:uncharacterized membrane protein YqjE